MNPALVKFPLSQCGKWDKVSTIVMWQKKNTTVDMIFLLCQM